MGTFDSFRPERRASIEDIAQAIHDSVTMDEILDTYCPSVPRRHHRMPCPLHNGKDFNFSYTNTGYKCWVCGAGGDVISFVKEFCETATRLDAMKRINADLGLNLPLDGTISASQSAEMALRRAEAEKKRKAEQAWEDKYNALMDAWCKLDNESRVETDPYELARIRESMTQIEYDLDSMPKKPG